MALEKLNSRFMRSTDLHVIPIKPIEDATYTSVDLLPLMPDFVYSFQTDQTKTDHTWKKSYRGHHHHISFLAVRFSQWLTPFLSVDEKAENINFFWRNTCNKLNSYECETNLLATDSIVDLSSHKLALMAYVLQFMTSFVDVARIFQPRSTVAHNYILKIRPVLPS